MNNIKFSPEMLKIMRLNAGFTQSQLAHLTCVSRSHIGMIENGKSLPSCNLLCGMANFLQVSVAVFFAPEPNVIIEFKSYGGTD